MKTRLVFTTGLAGGLAVALSAALVAGTFGVHNIGRMNTFVGEDAGNFTMTGDGYNTAIGAKSLHSDTTGFSNTASGTQALHLNTTGTGNTANGVNALYYNTTGFSNTANGVNALYHNTTGDLNTVNGYIAMQSNTEGNANTVVGYRALVRNTTGSYNIAIGDFAGGFLTTGNYNIAIGNAAGVAGEANTIRIGDSHQMRTFIAGIRGVTTSNANAIPVFVDSAGQLGTVNSSRSVKDDISDMGAASKVLMKLRPVTFFYKSDTSASGRTLQYGLIADEVEKIAPGLVAHSANGASETVYYQFLAPMLLNEYQQQQQRIEAQSARIAELEQLVARMSKQLTRLEQTQTVAKR